ncbi:glycoside hydrolase family 97 N-terminal domain-containing protein, partial [Flavobacterium anhuiense]|uniref:glycoside hydrolase family 97 N-terminal domain-containing protein n=1 Tax=Flavobacterium anhuiense TaxID=459526 RepID=UPI001A91E36B
MNIKFSICLLLVSFFKLNAQSVVKSPDGKLAVSVSVNKGIPQYSVTFNEKTFIEKSPLGLKTNAGDFSSGLALQANSIQNKIDESYQLRNIKKSSVHYTANEAVFSFTKEGRAALDVIFRVSNNNLAFKYKVYPQKETLSCVVQE